MRHRSSFEHLCRDLVTLILASAGATACGGAVSDAPGGGATQRTDTTPGPETSTATSSELSACTGQKLAGLEGFTPEPAVDYVSSRTEMDEHPYDQDAGPDRTMKVMISE